VAGQLDAFVRAGADELIILDWNLASTSEVVDTYGRLIDIAETVTPSSRSSIRTGHQSAHENSAPDGFSQNQ